jgi:hypothetical protein
MGNELPHLVPLGATTSPAYGRGLKLRKNKQRWPGLPDRYQQDWFPPLLGRCAKISLTAVTYDQAGETNHVLNYLEFSNALNCQRFRMGEKCYRDPASAANIRGAFRFPLEDHDFCGNLRARGSQGKRLPELAQTRSGGITLDPAESCSRIVMRVGRRHGRRYIVCRCVA